VFCITSFPIEELPVAKPECAAGATVVFEGTVRDQNEGRTVESLEYEALESLATKEGQRILDESLQRFPILGATCVHRVGHLSVGEVAIRVVVTAPHRREAFDACQWVVDEVKSRVPIWKKEHYADGSSGWIGAKGLTVDG